ncbi:hypothetical protein [Cohnella cholangitidis]|uniref:Uncharacterized protein n=1 Tax=Cohnella cholangitidis TaxID=2598458 RepID=A0A7G5BWB7_9BACL|nr:hypothetical protein [Cohnella cholangitidis]QMV41251.1 hypothetical protein FPL14_08620 [Cohnella cholangitidis]
MRVATGLLLALYLIFMWYQALTVEVTAENGEILNAMAKIILFFQSIAFSFVFTMPRTAVVFLLISSLLALVTGLGVDSSHIAFAVIGLIFTLMSYAGHRELVRKKKAAGVAANQR